MDSNKCPLKKRFPTGDLLNIGFWFMLIVYPYALFSMTKPCPALWNVRAESGLTHWQNRMQTFFAGVVYQPNLHTNTLSIVNIFIIQVTAHENILYEYVYNVKHCLLFKYNVVWLPMRQISKRNQMTQKLTTIGHRTAFNNE